MAKLGLIFVCVFLMVQWSLAARVVRDAPETPTAEESDVKSFDLNKVLTNFTQSIQRALSKENVDKFMTNLGETGEKLKELGQGLINKAQETAANIAHPAKKED